MLLDELLTFDKRGEEEFAMFMMTGKRKVHVHRYSHGNSVYSEPHVNIYIFAPERDFTSYPMWIRQDFLTAQCIIYELLKEKEDAA